MDIWALGVLLYEMLHGTAPFKGKTASEVQQAMLRGGYEQAAHLSDQVKNLIKSLLQFQAEKRPSLEEICEHRWVKDMEESLNSYLRAENATLPRDIHPKIIQIPNISSREGAQAEGLKHRKNNSLNFDDSRSININLEINNFAIMSKLRPKNAYHSQDKEARLEGCYTSKESDHRASLKKTRLEPFASAQISQLDIHRMIEKLQPKPAKLSSKDTLLEKGRREGKEGQAEGTLSKKKFKMRKSEVGFEKYPIRFNTEVNEKEEWEAPRLRKGNIKQKLLVNSKSMLRISKSGKF